MVLLLVAFAGFAASLVDGALGMGFGPTSSTFLLAAGLAPAAVSTTVNLAKVATGAAGGFAHWKLGNVDGRLVLQLAVPGCVGALAGVTVLSNVDGDRLRPYLAVLLLAVGLRMLFRFRRPVPGSIAAADASTDGHDGPPPAGAETSSGTDFNRRGLGVVALVGGVTNGLIGAWGPVLTPVLLHRKGLAPRVAIGSVNTAEIAVAVVASGSLIASLGGAGVEGDLLVALLIGGVVAAPIAAWAVRHLAPRLLGLGAGGMLILTNVRELAGALDLGVVRWIGYTTAVALIAAAAGWPRLVDARSATRDRQAPPRRDRLAV